METESKKSNKGLIIAFTLLIILAVLIILPTLQATIEMEQGCIDRTGERCTRSRELSTNEKISLGIVFVGFLILSVALAPERRGI